MLQRPHHFDNTTIISFRLDVIVLVITDSLFILSVVKAECLVIHIINTCSIMEEKGLEAIHNITLSMLIIKRVFPSGGD